MNQKFYVAQWGTEIFGVGETEAEALQDARENHLQFDDSDVKHISGTAKFGCGNGRKLVTAEGDELAKGMIVVMTEEQKAQYWD